MNSNLSTRAQQGAKLPAGEPNGQLEAHEQLRQDVGAFVRSGACDEMECEGQMIDAFAQLRGLQFRQAERLWYEILATA